MLPYSETIVRKYNPNAAKETFTWEQVDVVSIALIIRSNGSWKIQFEGEMEFSLTSGDTIVLPKNKKFKIIRGNEDLILSIKEA